MTYRHGATQFSALQTSNMQISLEQVPGPHMQNSAGAGQGADLVMTSSRPKTCSLERVGRLIAAGWMSMMVTSVRDGMLPSASGAQLMGLHHR